MEQQNPTENEIRPDRGRGGFPTSGAKGIRTPDPHTASVKATVLVRSAVSTEWSSVQLDELFSC